LPTYDQSATSQTGNSRDTASYRLQGLSSTLPDFRLPRNLVIPNSHLLRPQKFLFRQPANRSLRIIPRYESFALPARNLTLTVHCDSFIEATIASGRFRNASEAVPAGLDLLERQDAEDQAKIEPQRCHQRSFRGSRPRPRHRALLRSGHRIVTRSL
jgi:putative addiction module CopG family antidote